ncbi:MAG: lipoyl(octanoyl) transferase LipB [Nitrososphaerota archaeon]|jgi:lipoyl(octanoyl) transferase|nr:lipoyl(octanoyl) transferase LipB [Nitrososphaerota archaeon]MDG6953070.1 lipoyl(octanoyl) transferase LipB [Nitrososphaerota archaeon]MDG6955717.1 lipoyl(octanoyl) transferase LipB [Nitrososphaerota archaeon]MDG6960050.1 lipoyl(octanoyl) transferase LipB [Nitrososphaerota archaeon]MDG6972467.1 lipoyl(octanoyl) transferase LipB [Nitrososphaerota archaeon]
MSCFLFDFGTMEYGEALELQRELAAKRARGEIPDSLVLVEHPHVVTLGRKTTPDNFRPQKIPIFQVERGGDATYHGPGQLVGYPIFLLKDHDVRRHVRGIEEAVIRTAAAYGVDGERLEGHPGVWVGGKKLASIGVAVTDWVSYHGFALNVNTDLSYFELIRPCGLDPSTMTSMQKILGRPLPFEEVKPRFVREYSAVTGAEFSHQRLVSRG